MAVERGQRDDENTEHYDAAQHGDGIECWAVRRSDQESDVGMSEGRQGLVDGRVELEEMSVFPTRCGISQGVYKQFAHTDQSLFGQKDGGDKPKRFGRPCGVG